MNNFTLLRKIAKYLLPHYRSLLSVILAVIITSGSILILGQFFKSLVNQNVHDGIFLLNGIFFKFFLVVLILTSAIYLRILMVHSVSEKIIYSIRNDLYRKSLSLRMSYFEFSKTSDIVAKITSDTILLSGIIINIFSFAARNSLMFLGSLSLLFITNKTLTLYMMIIIPVTIFPVVILGRKLRQFSKDSQEKSVKLASFVEESLNGIKIVKSFNRESKNFDDFQQISEELLDSSLIRIKSKSSFVAIVICCIFTILSFILWIGSKEVASGNINNGELASFLFYSVIAATSLGSIAEISADFQRALGAFERIFALLDIKEIEENKKISNIIVNQSSSVIKFDKVSFSYPAFPERLILDNFNLEINSKEKLAIIGNSGTGKTTIFQLLLKFYDITKGDITIDGVSIQDIDYQKLRNLFGYVPQENIIFSNDAYYNINFSNKNYSKESIYEAAKIANIHEFLLSLPEEYHSFLGEKGMMISGGQKQRISIARAALVDPKILLLDEATNALDSENEKLIQNSLDKLMKGKTTLIIAHRFSTITNSDRIIILNNGKVEAEGKHLELLNNSNLYQKLLNNVIY